MKRKEYTKPKYVIMRWRRLPTFFTSYRSLLCTSCQSNWHNGCRNLEVFIFVSWGEGGGGNEKRDILGFILNNEVIKVQCPTNSGTDTIFR